MSQIGNGGASEFGSYVWGKGNSQHSISQDTNVISVANGPVAYKGGSKITTGGDLTTIAVPAVLVGANYLYNPKKKSFRKSKGNSYKVFRDRVRKGKSHEVLRNSQRSFIGGGHEISSASLMQKSDTLMNLMTPTNMPSHVYNNTNVIPTTPLNVPVYKGGNIKQTGAGILTDIAVPAVLLTANHLYRGRKFNKSGNGKKSRRNNKRSRRVSFKKAKK